MLYACVSRNLAQGYGSFWFPKFNEVGIGGLTTFHEHPPLVFWMQSLYFRVFGSGYLVEKFYSFSMALLTGWLIVLNWRLLVREKPELVYMGWLPVLYWIIMPIIYFSYQNNLMENTMRVFSLLSVYFALKGFMERKNAVVYMVLSGVAIFLASFSKGLPGLFTVSVAGIWWLTVRSISFRRMLLYTLVLVLVPVLIYLLLLLFSHEAAESLSNYLFKRALHRIENAPTVDSRFHVLGKLVVETLPALLVAGLVIVAGGLSKVKKEISGVYARNTLFVFLLGLAGTVPLMLTLVQKSFYFIHALPFYALGLAMVSAPFIVKWTDDLNAASRGFRILRLLLMTGLVAVLVYTAFQRGKTERDHATLRDVHQLGGVIPAWSVIGIDPVMHNN